MIERASARAPLRVLIVHNAYRERGGEDAVVDAEEDLLRRHGHEVLRYQRHNDEIVAAGGIAKLQLLRNTLWSTRTTNDMAGMLSDFKPDIMHVHNTLSLVSPSVYWAAHRASVPVVQTLHNFRLLCPQALLLRDGQICEDCVGRVPWRAVQHRCYRNSAPESAATALTLQTHRLLGTWRDKISLYIALNDFCRQKFIQGGLQAERLRVKPNFVDVGEPIVADRSGFLFVGRLSTEKGVATLVKAAQYLPDSCRVRVAGDGPMAVNVASTSQLTGLGPLSPSTVYEEMSRAVALVLPSICYENFPRTLAEAYGMGLPVIASRIGALATLVRHGETGLLFNPGDPVDLARTLIWAQQNPEDMRRMGIVARMTYERELTGEANIRQLEGIYREAIVLYANQRV